MLKKTVKAIFQRFCFQTRKIAIQDIQKKISLKNDFFKGMTGEINICDLGGAIYYGQIDYSYRDIINEFDYKLHLIEGRR